MYEIKLRLTEEEIMALRDCLWAIERDVHSISLSLKIQNAIQDGISPENTENTDK